MLLSLFFAVGCKKEKDITDETPEQTEWVTIRGVKWAKCNVAAPGIFAAKPEDAGMFYQWNVKTGWSCSDPMINHEDSTAWDNSIPEGDSWEKENDPCPAGWRVPTWDELQRLVAAGSEWTTLNGVAGRYFGSGANTVFLPVTGLRNRTDGALYYVDSDGYYWSSTPGPGNENAYGMRFYDGNARTYPDWRTYGFSIRCVVELNHLI